MENMVPLHPKVSPTLPLGAKFIAVEREDGKKNADATPCTALPTAKIAKLRMKNERR